MQKNIGKGFVSGFSYQSRNEVLKSARIHVNQVFMCHSCGVCTLR
jgi:hypothetical protein